MKRLRARTRRFPLPESTPQASAVRFSPASRPPVPGHASTDAQKIMDRRKKTRLFVRIYKAATKVHWRALIRRSLELVTVASMSAPILTMSRADDAARSLRRPSQVGTGARRYRADALLDKPHAGSMGLKSCEYGGKKRTVAPACSINVRTRGALWAARLSSTTISRRRRRGTSRRWTQSINRGVFIAPHIVLNASQRSTRRAPTSVRLSPQLRGRGSTGHCREAPTRASAPWPDSRPTRQERPSAGRRPDRSSPGTRGAPPGLSACLARLVAGVFFEDVPAPLQRPQHTRPMDLRLWRGALVVPRVSSSVVRSGRSWSSDCNNGRSTASTPAAAWCGHHRSPVAHALDPAHQGVEVDRKTRGDLGVVSVPPWYARTARSRSAVGYGFGMRVIDHGSITNSSEFRVRKLCRCSSRHAEGEDPLRQDRHCASDFRRQECHGGTCPAAPISLQEPIRFSRGLSRTSLR